jgi:hypothetical protein
MRKVFAILAVLGMAASTVNANTLFWISGSNTAPGVSEQPSLNASGTGNKFYIWGRPEEGKTLRNMSLNVVSTNDAALNFTDIEVINTLLGQITFPPPPKDIRRFEFVNDPAPGSPDQFVNFGGFSVTDAGPIGAGMGADTASLEGENYNEASNAFLIAAVTYDAVGAMGSSTDIFLQVGPNGINNVGGSSSDLNVIFGLASDPPLNANDNRQVNSATYDAKITVGEGGGGNEAPVAEDAGPIVAFVPETIMHTFMATDDGGAGGLTWGNLVFDGPSAPAIAPTLGADGAFSWDTTGSLGGDYTAMATVTDAGGLSDVATLSMHVIPEPSSALLTLVGLVGMVGYGLRKRG